MSELGGKKDQPLGSFLLLLFVFRGSGGTYGSPLVTDGDGVDGSVVVGWLAVRSYNCFAYETVILLLKKNMLLTEDIVITI